ncbi:KOW domain-containing RNA-binding protein [Mediterraneibacter glycyrrhizinilyticus]|nr:KOW domain-containing RNA-binding protein [Mediterraneibacter glycyrrhizinilyticus]MBM6853276.1 KOW domain-containing RNA-binding protein [Mediterraneibacter glycyrrhizinilyticus]
MDYRPGTLARSKAGRDKGCIYVIISVKNEYVYLADGGLRPLSRMKRKNIRHLQPVLKRTAEDISSDIEIRRVIREYEQQE